MEMHRFALRVPVGLWVELRVAAGRNRRSVNSEIVWRLSERRDIAAGRSEASELAGPAESAQLGAAVQGAPARRSESSPSFRPDFGSRLKEK
jgi:hypothetical protein